MNDALLHAFALTVVLSGVPLGAAMAIGLLCSVLQAATQIQDQSLTFVPKLTVVLVLSYFLARSGFELVSQFFSELLVQAAGGGAGPW